MKTSTLFLLAGSLFATDPDYTIMVVPDTQYMTFTCSPATLTQMFQWIVDNRAASQGGVFTTNLKAVIGLGDIAQSATSGEYTRAYGNSTQAYGILAANNITGIYIEGNHDCTDPTYTHATTNCPGVAAGGLFASDYQQTHSYYGSIGSGDTSAWGGSLNSTNFYVKLNVGSRRINVIGLEHQPSAAAMTWGKSIHDLYPSSEAIAVTHSLLSHVTGLYGAFSAETTYTGATNDGGNNNAGVKAPLAQTTSDVDFNSGYAMWNGYGGAAFTAMNLWNKLTLTLNGHWIAAEAHYADSPTTYNVQAKTNTSSSARAQAVYNVFANFQDMDNGQGASYPTWEPGGGTTAGDVPSSVGAFCNSGGAAPSSAFRIGHVMILQFRPGAGVVEGYVVSTLTGKWEPSYANRANTTGSTNPQLLFSLPYTGVPKTVFPLPGGATR